MPLLAKILIASFVSGVLALAGGVVLLGKPGWIRKFSVHLISFAVGALLATAFLDLLPEAAEMAQDSGLAAGSIFTAALLGLLTFFFLEKLIFKYHPHHHGEELGMVDSSHHHAAPFMLTVGDTIHNFIDGAIIAIAFLADPSLGILTAVAVAAHEIPQEIGDFSVMLYHGWARRKVLWSNVISSVASLLGATIAYYARDAVVPILPQALAFTAGIFVYIATSDLLPDLAHEEGRDKTWHVIVLVLLGIVVVGTLRFYMES